MILEAYKTLEEKEHNRFDNYKRINTAKEFDTWLEYVNTNNKNGEIVFRGICEAKYKNYTSAQREYIVRDLESVGVKLDNLIQKQIDSIRDGNKRLIKKYYESLGMSQNDLLYLSIAQHYGGISPLLDFSEDVKIALFFMTENVLLPTAGDDDINNYSSIYIYRHTTQKCVNYMDLIEDAKQQIQKRLDTIKTKTAKMGEIQDLDPVKELADFNLLKRINVPMLIPNEKRKVKLYFGKNTAEGTLSISNLNIVAQKGCFLFHYDENEPLRPLEKGIECVDIHKSLMPYIKKETLKRTTIESIYPKEFDIVRNSLQEALSEVVKAEL